MKKLALIAALLLQFPALALAKPEPWAAIKSTGGIIVGAPFHSTDGWLLGVRAKLSKLASPANPAAPDGGLSCVQTAAVVEGSNIYLTIISGEARGPIGAVCPAARLGEIETGSYKVYYRALNEPSVLLKEIQLER